MKNMKVRTKLNLILVLVILLVALGSVVSVKNMEDVKDKDRIRLQETPQWFLCFRRLVKPIGTAQPVPDFREAFFEGIRVLDDEPLKPLRMLLDNAETNRAAVVLQVHRCASETHLFLESGHHPRGIVK